MKFLILAAGFSSRYGSDKLREPVKGLTLPVRAALFAAENGATEIFLTLNRKAVVTDGDKIYHPTLEEVKKQLPHLSFKVRFQEDDKYGPGAAITCWKDTFDEDFIVLFGDNYYSGSLPELDPDLTYFTKRKLVPHFRNRQLAYVKESFIIEKPHPYIEGDFFCGFVHFPRNFWRNLPSLSRSGRNEYEIVDLVNFQTPRVPLDLDEIGLSWGDLTYQSDLKTLSDIVK